ncbi:hypothetical protein LWI28_020990 [Acer negundo]|uniref:Uncharacterized protein n=1 Tax=Acer negundo TaxID=4023 RepID=A0AAD5P632_ACENE|nr:hypothetical protein LWI28_020990 [Acer negundo]
MKGLSIIFLVFCFFLVSFFIDETSAADDQANINNDVYIVYMGSAASSNGYYHAQLLDSLLKRKENALVHSYKHGFSGFAARVSAEEALELSKKPGVVSVFPDPLIKLHTTRSWDFLKYQTDLLIDSNPNSNSDSQESDTIIGILDTGIWPESESFNDKNMGPIPTRWKGSCMKGDDDSSSFNSSTIDRDFQSLVMVGDGRVFKGEAINFSTLKKSPVHPLIYAKSAKKSDADEDQARRCNPESLDESLIKGAIVVCHNDDEFSMDEIKEQMQELGAIGVVVGNDKLGAVASNYGAFPMTVISSKDEAEILAYINSTRNPVATILPTDAVTPYMPAPVIAYFSSRGPANYRNILKPDIAAPGVNILAAWMGNDTQEALQGKEPPLFNVISGTSMSCPHVSGIAANVKQQNPSWSPSAIRSAIMTTATQNNNKKAAITTDAGSIATPYDFGAGEISPTAPLQPGLVYETDTVDYLNFLCYSGYNISKIKVIATTIPNNFTCPKESSIDLISNINYPSISISGFKESRTVTRTATNVAGDGESSYVVSIDAPKGINAKVIPDKLQFSKNGEKLSYQVTLSSTVSSLKEDLFGSITWSNGKYKVRIPFAVSSSTSNKGSDN